MDVVRALSARIESPCGKLALLIDEDRDVPLLLLPRELRERVRHFEIPPFHLVKGRVVASGVPDLPIGAHVWAMPAEGLHMTHADLEMVPEGREVRFYGAMADWRNQVVGWVVG